MDKYSQRRKWKYILFAFVVLIGILSTWYTNRLMHELLEQERQRIELWAAATESLINAAPNEPINDIVLNVTKSNETIPIIVVDNQDNIIIYRNLDSAKMTNQKYQKQIIEEFRRKGNENFYIKISEDETYTAYYTTSSILDKVYYYPFIQLGIVFLFIFFAYLSFNIYTRAEQNHVWLGMSKETAHQLGTPISSLMAWVEILKSNEDISSNEALKKELNRELENDVKRLEKISTRFSKIGSVPKLEVENIVKVINNSVEYLQTRIPKNISLSVESCKAVILCSLNADLFEWVVENICKNAADAIGENGSVNIVINETGKHIYIDISDTGKGIYKSKFSTIFQPGYTTKKRGWGLGLSLVKRIVEQYHTGKVFVKHSKIGFGTTFRIILKK